MSERNHSFPAVQVPTRRRLPFGFQVLAVIGVLFAVLAASIVVTVLSLVSLSEDQHVLQDKNVPYAVAIATAALNAKGMANDERGYLISGNREFLEELEQRLLSVRTSFSAALIAAEGERQRNAIRSAHAGFEKWVWVVRGNIKTFQAGKRQAATESALGRDRQLRKRYEASLAKAQDVASTAIQLRNNPLASSGWMKFLLVSLFAVLAICVGLAVWVMRTVNFAVEVDETSEPLPAPVELSPSTVRAIRRHSG